MKIPTILDFIASCLEKSGHKIKTYHLSDNSSSGISIYKDRNGQKYMIEIQFTGDGLRLTDINVYKRHFNETDQTKLL